MDLKGNLAYGFYLIQDQTISSLEKGLFNGVFMQ